jgi:DNA-binding transcriptional MerR regulator
MIKDIVVNSFTTEETSQIVIASIRQLGYWDKTNLLKPSLRGASGRGTRRIYSMNDIIELKIIISLLNSGLSVQRIRHSLQYVRGISFPLSELRILTDGNSIYFSQEEGVLVDTVKSGQMVSQIIVGRLIQEVEETVSRLFSPKQMVSNIK